MGCRSTCTPVVRLRPDALLSTRRHWSLRWHCARRPGAPDAGARHHDARQEYVAAQSDVHAITSLAPTRPTSRAHRTGSAAAPAAAAARRRSWWCNPGGGGAALAASRVLWERQPTAGVVARCMTSASKARPRSTGALTRRVPRRRRGVRPGERSCMLTVAESTLIVTHREILRAVPKAPRRKGVELPLYCGRSIPCNPVTKRTELPMSMALRRPLHDHADRPGVDRRPCRKGQGVLPQAETRTLRREALDALFEPAGTNPGAPSNSPREFLRRGRRPRSTASWPRRGRPRRATRRRSRTPEAAPRSASSRSPSACRRTLCSRATRPTRCRPPRRAAATPTLRRRARRCMPAAPCPRRRRTCAPTARPRCAMSSASSARRPSINSAARAAVRACVCVCESHSR